MLELCQRFVGLSQLFDQLWRRHLFVLAHLRRYDSQAPQLLVGLVLSAHDAINLHSDLVQAACALRYMRLQPLILGKEPLMLRLLRTEHSVHIGQVLLRRIETSTEHSMFLLQPRHALGAALQLLLVLGPRITDHLGLQLNQPLPQEVLHVLLTSLASPLQLVTSLIQCLKFGVELGKILQQLLQPVTLCSSQVSKCGRLHLSLHGLDRGFALCDSALDLGSALPVPGTSFAMPVRPCLCLSCRLRRL
mmetsp:Transcript_6614/g.15709  ORF Transcript_6614/g.15709 Transcript_6614/m.15709 type:complete len:248 (-) Transcript_6614:243-986(-)